jgi:hypothetical protein
VSLGVTAAMVQHIFKDVQLSASITPKGLSYLLDLESIKVVNKPPSIAGGGIIQNVSIGLFVTIVGV